MAEDVKQRRLHKQHTLTRPILAILEEKSILQPQFNPDTTSATPPRCDRSNPDSFFTQLNLQRHPHVPRTAARPTDSELKPEKRAADFEQEINLSPVYENPLSVNGPPKARTYHCSQCFKSTDSPRLHLHHLVKEHGLELTIYECDVCDYATKYKQKLIHHRSCHQTTPGPLVAKANSQCDMLGSSTEDDTYGDKVNKLQADTNGTGRRPMEVDARSVRVKDINENVKQSFRNPTETGLDFTEKMESFKQGLAASDEQDLLCNESVANDSAEFEMRTPKASSMIHEEDGNHLVIDLGDNRHLNNNNNNNNSNIDTTPAILRAVSLATANSMVGRPTMVPVALSAKRDADLRPSPSPTATSGGAKLTKKGTVPVREAVDPAKYVKLQDVDGVRYACSKCGNVYKWRKSLNKHWKEKHDGEIPVPASGSFSSILNIPHIKGGGTPHYSTPKSTATSARTLVTPSAMNSSGMISSYALDKYIVDMGAQSGGRSIPSYNPVSMSSAAHAAAAAAAMATRNMFNKPGSFNSMLHANIPFAQAQQHLSFGGMRFVKPETTVTTSVLPKFPNFNAAPQEKMRLPTILPPAAHGRGFMKHDVLDEDSCDDMMPLDLSKKSIPSASILDLTSPAASMGSSRPGSAVTGDQPLDFSFRSNPGSERSTPVQASMSRGHVDRDDLQDQSWMRATSTPESDVFNNLQCYKCPFVASDKVSFDEHLEQHTSNQGQYPQCAQCKQHFSSNDELTQHFGLHHLQALNQINNSDEENNPEGTGSTPSAGQLYQYLTKAQESREQKCAVCNARFPWQRDLARHFTHLHPDLPNPYKKRNLEADSNEHEPWHKVSKFERYGSNEGRQGTSEGELECEQCTFVARDTAEMSRHQLVHSFNRPHACTMCGFSSKSQDELQSHIWKYHPNHAEELALMASSGGTTPISVGKSKGTNGGMNDDSLSHNAADTSGSSAHSGEFGYDDVIIVTPNTTEVPLVRARKSGKGGTSSSAEILLPYKCSVCEYRARWPSEITQHMKNHSDEKPYRCPRCTYKSKWKWDVVKHLKRCGGGTVKDVIDTTRNFRKSDQEDSYTESNESVVKQLQFRNSSPKQSVLSNGPPNVTVLPSGSPHALARHEANRSCTPTSSSSDIIPYSRNTSSPANSVSSEPTMTSRSEPNDLQSEQAKTSMFRGLVNQGLYHCLQCPFIGNSPAELKRHCRVHSDEKPFTCQTCGYSSKWKCDLKKHVRTYNHRPAPRSGGKPGEDRSGEDDMSSSDEMSVDLTTEGPRSVSPSEPPVPKPTLYKCDKCQYVTYKKHFLDGHLRIHRQSNAKGGKFKCKQCDYLASDLSSFLQHKLTHSAQQASDASSVIPEVEAVNLETTKVDREGSPQRHRRKPLKYLSCAKCPYNCLNQPQLEIHESMHEPRGPDSLTCEFCEYNVYNRALLIQHMKLHPQFDDWYRVHGNSLDDELQEEVDCIEMDEAEQTEALCDTEDSMHTGSKNGSVGMKLMVANPKESGHGFQCNTCEFRSESRKQFEDHIQQHVSGQKYQCEHCDWGCVKLNYLYKHVREVHPQQLTLRESDGNNTSREGTPTTEERSEIRNSLRKPQKQHTCADCGYISENSSKMATHKLKHQSEEEKRCHYCDQTLINMAEMQTHLLSIHDVQIGNSEDDINDQKSESISENSKKRARSPGSNRISSMSPSYNEVYNSDDPSSQQLIDIKGQQVYLIQKGNRKVFGCQKCSYRTNNSSHCASHVMQHGSGKKYTCEYCDYSLEKLSQIFHHMKMCHSNEMDTTDTETDAPSQPIAKGANGSTDVSLSERKCEFSGDMDLSLHNSTGCHQKKRKIIPTPKAHRRKTKVVYKSVLQKAATPTPARKGRMKIRYRCARCPYSTACKSNIIKHRKSHIVSSKYKCPHCDYSATRYSLLKQHVGSHTNNGATGDDDSMYKDIYLDTAESTTTSTTNGQGTKTLKSGNILKCKQCPFSCLKLIELKEHGNLHGGKGKYRCDYCTYSITKLNLLTQHRQLHQDRQGFNSHPEAQNLLNKRASSRGSMLPKLRIVLKPVTNKNIRPKRSSTSEGAKNLYNCAHCPFSCNKRQSYDSHVRHHGAEGRHQCQYCNYTVDRTNTLHQHERLHENSQGNVSSKGFTNKRLRCAKCPYHTHSKPLLDLHNKMHTGQQQANTKDGEPRGAKLHHQCERCPYQTNKKNSFENHKSQHVSRSKLSCPYCDFSSQRTAQLGSHIKLHLPPGSALDTAALRALITGANVTAEINPDTPLTLEDAESSSSSVGSRSGSLEPFNNNNTETKRASVCQYCERNFVDEAEKIQHEQQHLVGTC